MLMLTLRPPLLIGIVATLAVAAVGGCAIGVPLSPAQTGAMTDSTVAVPLTSVGAPHDFDFEHGQWRTTLRRRLQPLSGSDTWVDYVGTTTVQPLLDGRANVVELDVSGTAGRIQGLSLRLFDTKQQRWTLNFSNVASGTLATPMTGGFGGGRRGVFYSAEEFNGRRILVRFVIESTDANTCRFEQAFSADGGATWETNWIAVDTRS